MSDQRKEQVLPLMAALWVASSAMLCTVPVSSFARMGPAARQGAEGVVELTERLAAVWQEYTAFLKLPTWTSSQEEAYIARMDLAITDYTVGRLNRSPRPSAASLELELNEATTRAFTGMSFQAIRLNNPDFTGPVVVLQESGSPASSIYVVAVSLGAGNAPWNVVRILAKQGGSYESVARTGDDFKNRRLQLFMMRPFEPDEARFLISGLYIGSPEGLTKIVLYSFDRQRLKVIWQRDSVPNAQISFAGRNVMIRSYLPTVNKRPWVSTLETYAQVPTGLKLLRVEHGTVQ